MRFSFVLLTLALLLYGSTSYAAVDWDDACKDERVFDPKTGAYTWVGTRGKYFCIQEKPKDPPKPVASASKSEPKKEEVDCDDPTQWKSECGFVNPDSLPPEEAFEFQAKQRDRLLQNMAVRPDSMESVMNAQRYINWVVDKAMLLSDMYEYTAVQNPSLDPNASHSSANFAQKLIAARDLDNRTMFWAAMKSWDSELVLFTRKSCDFCSQQAETLHEFIYESELTLIEVALEECIVSYASDCISGEAAEDIAAKFSVEVVPTTMVFVPDSKGKTPADGLWMRVSNGFSTGAKIKGRLFSYLNAWHSAASKGLKTAMESPDFLGTQSMSRKELHDRLNNVIGTKESK
jgi:conjugal transfer pilus assembly protein TraF